MMVSGCELGQELCKVFGLDPNLVGKITIVSNPDDVAKVLIERLITDEETRKLSVVLEKFTLAAFEEGKEVPQSVSAAANAAGHVVHGKSAA